MKPEVCVLLSLVAFIICLCTNEGFGQAISDDDFVRINGGCFHMGDQFGDGLPDELPVHLVCLSDYYLSKYEVTQKQYLEVMGHNPSQNQGSLRYPVDVVSWHDIDKFINKLNTETDETYRLPTEAEWEYACRSGGKKVKYGTADGTSADLVLIHSGTSAVSEGVKPVGSLPPNELGLYDMSGNVSEWVLDWYDRNFYSKSPVNDPVLAEDKTKRKRVRKGGYWGDNEWVQRCSFRNFRKPNYHLVGLGFRLAKEH